MDLNRGGRPRHPDILTPAEWRVLEQLREGGTNAEIAVRLGISPDTVKYHISNMLAKLGVGNRRDLAGWRPETKRSLLPAVLAGPVALGSVVRPLVWVAIGGAALGAVAVVAVALVALAGNGDQPVAVAPPPTDSTGPSSSPTQAPPPAATPPEATPTPQPQATATPSSQATLVPTPQPTVASAVSSGATPPPTPDPSEAATFRYDAFGTDPPATIRAVLQPGLNLAGWTEPDASVALIFDAIPELTYVYAWDPDHQWFRWATRTDSGIVGDLKTLTPGMGLWLDVGGDAAVTWERPLIPQSGLAELREGWNLIVWAGDDGITTSEALKHLDGIVAAALDANGGRPATLTRGAAFWLKASAPRPWWQLDDPPRIEFVGDYSPAERQYVRALADDVVAYYAKRFGHTVPGLIVRYGEDSIAACAQYQHSAIVMRTGCAFALVHEYAHAIQAVLKGLWGTPANWLVEGVATRWAEQYTEAEGGQTFAETVRDAVLPHVRATAKPLSELEPHGSVMERRHYSLAVLATELLTSLAGESSLYEFHARRFVYTTWQEAFHAVFGLTVQAFYDSFVAYRSEVAPLWQIHGTVLGPEGVPQDGVQVWFEVPSIHQRFYVTTDRGGGFQWTIGASFILSLAFDGCPLEWSSADGRLTLRPDGRTYVTPADLSAERLILSLSSAPSEACRSVGGIVTDLAGSPRKGVVVRATSALPRYELTTHEDRLEDLTDADGRFAIAVPRGQYRVFISRPGGRAAFLRSTAFYRVEGEVTPQRFGASVIDTKSSSVTGMAIRSGTIGGKVLGLDGEPVLRVFVQTHLHGHSPGSEPGPRGDFVLDLPEGVYTLGVSCLSGGGGWYGGERGFTSLEREATPIVLETRDVEGIVINVPFTQADVDTGRCPKKAFDVPLVKGLVLGPNDEPRRDLWVKLSDQDAAHTISNEHLSSTRVNGSFQVEEVSAPDYLYIRLRPDRSCTPGLEGDWEWIALGRTRGDGRFIPASDLPDGVSVEAADDQSIVVRLPDCP